ncbi:MAG: signal peptidase II [Ilumatobacteraceae bacterium]
MSVEPAVIDETPPPVVVDERRGGGSALPLAIAAGVVLLDQLTKHWAQHALRDETIHVFWTLQLNLTFNSGMAFAAGRGIGPIIGAVAIVVIIGLALSARRASARQQAGRGRCRPRRRRGDRQPRRSPVPR